MKRSILHVIIFTPIAGGRWGLPVLFTGPPGVGKSAIIEAHCRAWGLHCETLSPGERGEGAFGVTPVPTERGENGKRRTLLSYPPPDWLELVQDGGCVFLDEMSCAAPALQQPMLGMIQRRVVGSAYMGDRTRCIGAANPVDQATGGWDLTPAVANRLGHISWEAPSAEAWSAWLIGTGADGEPTGDARAEEKRVLKEWPSPWAKACGAVTGFIQRKRDQLHSMPPVGSPQLSAAWPSHRSWENATRALASAEVHGLNEVDREMIVSAFVGAGAGQELFRWLESADLPDPAALLDGKEKYEFDKRRLDRTMAVYGSCAALVAQDKDKERRERRGQALWALLALAADHDCLDVAMPAARTLCVNKLSLLGSARGLLTKLEPVIRLVGVTP